MIRTSIATWKGSGKNGTGQLTIQSQQFSSSSFDFKGRFSLDGQHINPEELIAAAHAMDFVMKLSFVLGEAGYEPELIETTANISFINGSITGSHLVLRARVPGISKEIFAQCVLEAQLTCPMGRALNLQVTIKTELET